MNPSFNQGFKGHSQLWPIFYLSFLNPHKTLPRSFFVLETISYTDVQGLRGRSALNNDFEQANIIDTGATDDAGSDVVWHIFQSQIEWQFAKRE